MSFWKDLFAPLEYVADLFTGGAISEHKQSATREANMNDWLYQQKVLSQYQKEMIDYQNKQNLVANAHMQDITNHRNRNEFDFYYQNYNSPSAIMNAYSKAGINPNLIAGSVSGGGSPTLNSAGSVGSSGNISTAPGNNMKGNISGIADLLNQIEVVKYQRLKNEEQSILNDKLRKEQPYFEHNAEQNAIKLRSEATSIFNSLNIQEKEAEKILAETDLLKTQKGQLIQLIDNMKVDKEKAIKATALMGAQQLYYSSLKDLTDKQKEQLQGIIDDWKYHTDNGSRDFHKNMRKFTEDVARIYRDRTVNNDQYWTGWHNFVNHIFAAVPGGTPISPYTPQPLSGYSSPY